MTQAMLVLDDKIGSYPGWRSSLIQKHTSFRNPTLSSESSTMSDRCFFVHTSMGYHENHLVLNIHELLPFTRHYVVC